MCFPFRFQGIASWCKKQSIDLVIVGPEDPLANGLGDALNKAGVRCFGPNKKGAQIEADKKWAKDFMLRHSIPTARYASFTDVNKAKDFINRWVREILRIRVRYVPFTYEDYLTMRS